MKIVYRIDRISLLNWAPTAPLPKRYIYRTARSSIRLEYLLEYLKLHVKTALKFHLLNVTLNIKKQGENCWPINKYIVGVYFEKLMPANAKNAAYELSYHGDKEKTNFKLSQNLSYYRRTWF